MDGKAEKYGVQPIVEKAGIHCVPLALEVWYYSRVSSGFWHRALYDGQVEFQNHMIRV